MSGVVGRGSFSLVDVFQFASSSFRRLYKCVPVFLVASCRCWSGGLLLGPLPLLGLLSIHALAETQNQKSPAEQLHASREDSASVPASRIVGCARGVTCLLENVCLRLSGGERRFVGEQSERARREPASSGAERRPTLEYTPASRHEHELTATDLFHLHNLRLEPTWNDAEPASQIGFQLQFDWHDYKYRERVAKLGPAGIAAQNAGNDEQMLAVELREREAPLELLAESASSRSSNGAPSSLSEEGAPLELLNDDLAALTRY